MPKFEYEYYSGNQTEHFRFLPVPKILYESSDYEDLDLTAVMLYSMLHEQVALSRKNGWIDETGRVYVIKTLESMHKSLKCSTDKARTALNRLIEYGLIEKKRRGQGKPDLIYVKDYASKKQEKTTSKKSDDCGKLFSETGKSDVLTSEKPVSRDGNFRSQEVANSHPINTLLNNTDFSDTNPNPIYVTGNTTKAVDNSESGMDEDETEALIEQIKANIDYAEYAPRYRAEHNNRYEELFQIIVEKVVGKYDTVTIGDAEYPKSLVQKRFLSLNSGHVEYVMWKVAENLGEIHSIKKYMIAALFNAPTTMDTFYTQLVHHDMYGGGWAEKEEQRKRQEEARKDEIHE